MKKMKKILALTPIVLITLFIFFGLIYACISGGWGITLMILGIIVFSVWIVYGASYLRDNSDKKK